MTPGPGIEPGPHWKEASALTTASSLRPRVSFITCSQINILSKFFIDLCKVRIVLWNKFNFLAIKTRKCHNLVKISKGENRNWTIWLVEMLGFGEHSQDIVSVNIHLCSLRRRRIIIKYSHIPFLIGHVRYIDILPWLRSFGVVYVYSSILWELSDKRNLTT